MPEERSPAHVRQVLEPLGLGVRELNADTSTSVLAAQALGTSVGSIAKSLLFFVGDDPVLVVASGDTRISTDKLGRLRGNHAVRLAKPREVIATTGYRVGGVPPVAHATPVHVLMDRALMTYDTVYAAAGSPLAIFPVAPDLLREISGAELVDVAEESRAT